MAALAAVPGAGAAELQIEAQLRSLGASATECGLPRPQWASAVAVLGEALLAPVKQLHTNALRASALPPNDTRWLAALQRLRREHDASVTCAMGLVVAPTSIEGTAGVQVQRIADAHMAGIREPLCAKLALLDRVQACVVQLLMLDAVVPVRRVVAHAQRRRRRQAAEESESSEGELEADGSSSDSSCDD